MMATETQTTPTEPTVADLSVRNAELDAQIVALKGRRPELAYEAQASPAAREELAALESRIGEAETEREHLQLAIAEAERRARAAVARRRAEIVSFLREQVADAVSECDAETKRLTEVLAALERQLVAVVGSAWAAANLCSSLAQLLGEGGEQEFGGLLSELRRRGRVSGVMDDNIDALAARVNAAVRQAEAAAGVPAWRALVDEARALTPGPAGEPLEA